VKGWKIHALAPSSLTLEYPVILLSSLCPLYFGTMSDTGDFTYYYQGYKQAVSDNLPSGIVYGEGQETRRYLSNSLRYEYDHRCLYRGLHCLGLCHPVSCPLEENDDTCLQWLSGANRVLLRVRVECPCLESQLLFSPWGSSHWR
jgi:hypothetical protein